MTVLFSIIKVVLLFGLTVFVHELGHFLLARRLGLVVDVFSIGFGPAIWKKKINGITYKIGCLPLGGYVALPQMNPDGGKSSSDDDTDRILPSVAPWRRIIVAAAGAAGNMLLALLLCCLVYWQGEALAPEKTNVVGYVSTNCPAWTAGLRAGDEIIAIQGQVEDNATVTADMTEVQSWESFLVESALYDSVALQILTTQGEERTISLPTVSFMGGRYIEGVGPVNYCYILHTRPGSSAAEAGLEAGDRIVSLNGVKLLSREHLIQLVDEHRDELLPAVIDRDGKELTFNVRPRYDEEIGRALIGIAFNTLEIRKPLTQIKSYATLIFRFLRALVTPKEAKAAARSAGGPVAIFNMFWYAVQSSFLLALSLTALINVNLAILNMLPIPVLDGGHIVFALWEWITRRPVNEKFMTFISNFFAIILIGLIILLTFQDVRRLIVPLFKSKDATTTEQPVVTDTNAPPIEQE